MNRKLSKIKTLLIGFVAAKIIVTLIYFAGSLPLADFLFTQKTAEAQDSAVAQKTESADKGQDEAADKEKQYADVQALMNQLEIKRLQLKDEEEKIKQERVQLEDMKRDIDLKLDELSAAQAKMDASLAKKGAAEDQEKQAQDAAEEAKIKQLVKVYNSMSPKKAAAIIDKLDMKVIYEVFSNMKGDQVGQILTYVSPDRAVEITERLAAKTAKE